MKPIKWSTRAAKDLEKITKFYIQLYGNSKAREIVTELRKSTEILEKENVDTSKIGAINASFSHLKYDYRKLLMHHCKITYREERNNIFIVRVFDTRQDPKKNK